MIAEAVKAFLKPIITEALQEAGVNADAEPVADYLVSKDITRDDNLPATDDNGYPLPPRLYSVDEVKAILHIGTTSVYNLFKRRKLTKLKVLGKTMVNADELEQAIETKEIARYKHGK